MRLINDYAKNVVSPYRIISAMPSRQSYSNEEKMIVVYDFACFWPEYFFFFLLPFSSPTACYRSILFVTNSKQERSNYFSIIRSFSRRPCCGWRILEEPTRLSLDRFVSPFSTYSCIVYRHTISYITINNNRVWSTYIER